MPNVKVIVEVEGGLTMRDVRIEENESPRTRGETLDAIKECARQATNAAIQAVSAQ